MSIADLRHLVGRIGGITATIVEEVADVVSLEDFDQALVLSAVLFQTLQLVTTGPKGTRRCVAQRRNGLVAFQAGVDEILGQGPDDSVAARIHPGDGVGVPARRLDDGCRGGIDYGGDTAGLRIKGIFHRAHEALFRPVPGLADTV